MYVIMDYVVFLIFGIYFSNNKIHYSIWVEAALIPANIVFKRSIKLSFIDDF